MSSVQSIPNQVFSMMGTHLRAVTVELFAAYDLSVVLAQPEAHLALGEKDRSCAAVIGYVGEHVRGALVLAAPDAAIRQWTALVGATPGDEADTIGEFSNMLLGRLKGRLLAEGLPIFLATPTTTSGAGLRLSLTPGYSISLLFEGTGWQVTARLDATFDLGFALKAPPQGNIAEAGDAILF